MKMEVCLWSPTSQRKARSLLRTDIGFRYALADRSPERQINSEEAQ